MSYQQYPHHQPAPPQVPPAKKRKWPIVLGVIAAILVLGSAFNNSKESGSSAGDDRADNRAQAVAALPTRTYSAPPPTLDPVGADEPELLVVPSNLKGQNMAVVLDVLRKTGFTNVRTASADKHDTVVILPQNWTVTKVSAKERSTIPSDTLIVVTGTKQ